MLSNADGQVSLWNFLQYNVAGGGDSALYGVEAPTFYLRNALTNLNIILPLALAAPAVLALGLVRQPGAPTSICRKLF